MIRFRERTEKGIRVVAMIVTVITITALADIFFDALISCLRLVWKHTVGGVDAPVLGDIGDMENELIWWGGFCMAIMVAFGMRKRLKAIFRGKPWKWHAVLVLPQFMVAIVIYVANWGAGYGILFRSGGNMGIYYDQLFSYAGWGVLSGLSLFVVVLSVFGMERIYVEQKKAGQYQAQVAVYQMLQGQYSQAERLRHDLKNHMLALRGLWVEQAWEKLGDYLMKMENGAQLGTNEETTGNRAVDAILQQKRKLAEDRGIDWECDVRIPKDCQINEFDLCILFGNILDNAVEACRRLQREAAGQRVKPFIRVQACTVKKCFLLEARNSMDAGEKLSGETSEKENRQGHGIGLLNVGDVVRGYDGAMNTEIGGGVFGISVLLPLRQNAYDMERAV